MTRGRSKAAPPKIVKPVSRDLVERTLPYLSPVVADMIRVQLFTGCRPSEICNMRPCDIDRSGDVWKFIPMEYKTDYLDGIRPPTAIGPRAQAILTPYLEKLASTPESFVFSPHDAVKLQRIEKRKKRKSLSKKGEVQPSQRNRFKLTPRWNPRDHYSADTYRQAIERGTQKAGLPHWTPHQLRHNAGTEIREK